MMEGNQEVFLVSGKVLGGIGEEGGDLNFEV